MTPERQRGRQYVLDIFAKLHAEKFGCHWLWVAIERLVAGESEEDVMRDYGYERVKSGTEKRY